jgi:hypothetical protein
MNNGVFRLSVWTEDSFFLMQKPFQARQTNSIWSQFGLLNIKRTGFASPWDLSS